MSNHYETLGVAKDATNKEIKQAYRALSMKYHPDRVGTDDAIDKMKQVNEAYSVLGDPEQRQHYNMELDNPFGQGQNPFGQGTPFGQGFNPFGQGTPFGQGQNPFGQGTPFPPGLFEMLFSNGGGPEIHFFHQGNRMVPEQLNQRFFQQRKPAPIIKPIEITLAQSYSGIIVDVDSLKIHIPAGINDGNTIIIANAGQEIHLKIQVKNDGPFTRDGNNLVFKHKVSLKEALCGFKFHIDHLNGNKLSFNMNAIVYPGAKQIIKNMGFPQAQAASQEAPLVPFGDLIIKFDVEFPTQLTQEQKDALFNIL
jgi:DnaJ-class molecular chaperone